MVGRFGRFFSARPRDDRVEEFRKYRGVVVPGDSFKRTEVRGAGKESIRG
jgi:hypothetical protein